MRQIESIRIRSAENGATVSISLKPEKKKKGKGEASPMYEPDKDSVFQSAASAKSFVCNKIDQMFDSALTEKAWSAANKKWDK